MKDVDECDDYLADDANSANYDPDAFWKMTIVSAMTWAAIAFIALVLWVFSLVCPIS